MRAREKTSQATKNRGSRSRQGNMDVTDEKKEKKKIDGCRRKDGSNEVAFFLP